MGPTLKSITWLMFSKYSFQKIISYFHYAKLDFENSQGDVFKIHKIFLMT